jgi:hypothetical protein
MERKQRLAKALEQLQHPPENGSPIARIYRCQPAISSARTSLLQLEHQAAAVTHVLGLGSEEPAAWRLASAAVDQALQELLERSKGDYDVLVSQTVRDL